MWVSDFQGFRLRDSDPRIAKVFLDLAANHYPGAPPVLCELIRELINQSAKLIGQPIKGRAKTDASQSTVRRCEATSRHLEKKPSLQRMHGAQCVRV